MTERRPSTAEENLDQVIARLRHGSSHKPTVPMEPPTDDVARLVDLAARLCELAVTPPPPPGALRAGRERLLAASRAANHRLRSRRRFATLLRPVACRWVAAAAVCLALMTAFLASSGAIASASSLPGDPFYPVKRAAESVQLALAFAPEKRAALEQTLEERRLAEVRALLELRRQAQASFRGTVTALSPNTIEIAGLVVYIGPNTRIEGHTLAIGDVVAVLARSQPEGGLVAENIRIIPRTPLPPLLAHASASAPALSKDVKTPSPSIPESATASMALTSTLPASSAMPTMTLASTITIAAMAQWQGTLEMAEGDQWQVAGHTVLVGTTSVMGEGAAAEVGRQVRVLALATPDSVWRAVRITALPAATGGPPSVWAIGGILSALEADRWVIGGWPLLLTPNTAVRGEPVVGALVTISAHAQEDGSIVVDSAAVAPANTAVVMGTIEHLDGSVWLVSGVEVRLLPEALLLGELQEGARVAIWGEGQPDGTLLAHLVCVQAPPPTEPAATTPLAVTPTTVASAPEVTATP
ncbi:MAG: DUF5666 domain-containing protein [Anaerolineae bacterium]